MNPLPSPRSRLLAVALIFLAWPIAGADDPSPRKSAQEDLKKLQGTWECVAMEREGDEIAPEHLKGSSVVYEEDLATIYRDGEIFRRGIITLDATKPPRKVNTWDLSGPYADQTVPGIYEFEGEDTLKICFSRPGVERPSEFTTKKGSGFLVATYKRKKP